MKLIDTHCHLASEKLCEDVQNILKRAHENHIETILNVAYNLETSHRVLEQLKTSPMLYGALGIQPHDASEYTPEIAETIKTLITASPRVIAVGEIGLDAYYHTESLPKQITCFEHFLNIACEIRLPVIIHVRNTHHEMHMFLEKYSKRGLRGVIHCFTGTKNEARQFLDCGFYISFSGIVTFKNARNIAEVAQFIPDDRILIETDAPYLAPVPMRGKINEPSYLLHTCVFIAQQRNTSVETFADQTYHNAHELFELRFQN